jgi:ATP-dependent DNA ligase
MGALPPKAIARQKDAPLHYYIFDIYQYGNKSFMDAPTTERAKAIKWLSEEYQEYGNYIEFAEYVDTPEEIIEMLQTTLASGGEGIVMSLKDKTPMPGKRKARATLKVKKELEDSIDCFFTGRVKEPTRLYQGKHLETWQYWHDVSTGARIFGDLSTRLTLNQNLEAVSKDWFEKRPASLEIGVYKDNKVVGIGWLSGLTEEQRDGWKEVAGMVCSVNAMEIETGTSSGLRHARLDQVLPDADPKDCTWERVFGENK